jgi:hypothetical protein
MTTEMLSTISLIPRLVEHELVVLSRHRTSDGVVTWTRCDCGDLQIWLTRPGNQTPTLLKSATGRCG